MKKPKAPSIRLPRTGAGYEELADFFDRHASTELLRKRIVEPDPDREDIDRMLLEYWKRPNTRQLNVRVPARAKQLIDKLAKRSTVQASTLVRLWVIEGMRREAMKP